MNALSVLRNVQRELGVKDDGDPGPLTHEAFGHLCALARMNPLAEWPARILAGDASWPWWVVVEGNDLVVYGARATCFGGSDDPEDDGQTASDFSTKGHPTLEAVSLPMRNDTLRDRLGRYVLRGSPLPRMPFGLHADGSTNPDGCWVEITTPRSPLPAPLLLPCIDIGPAKWTGNALDMTIAAARRLDPHATALNFEATVDYRIKNGARWLA